MLELKPISQIKQWTASEYILWISLGLLVLFFIVALPLLIAYPYKNPMIFIQSSSNDTLFYVASGDANTSTLGKGPDVLVNISLESDPINPITVPALIWEAINHGKGTFLLKNKSNGGYLSMGSLSSTFCSQCYSVGLSSHSSLGIRFSGADGMIVATISGVVYVLSVATSAVNTTNSIIGNAVALVPLTELANGGFDPCLAIFSFTQN